MLSGNRYRASLVKKTALLSAVIAWLGASLMFLFATQDTVVTVIAAFNCSLLSATAFFIYRDSNAKYNSIVLIAGLSLALIIAITFLGGINSRFTVMLPILPMMMCFLLHRSIAISLTIVLIAFVVGVNFIVYYIPDYAGVDLVGPERFAKTVWLVLALVLHLVFGLIFVNIISKLTIALESKGEVDEKTGLYGKEVIIAFAEKILFKLRSGSARKRRMAIMIIEANVKSDETLEAQQREMKKMSGYLQKMVKHESSMIGHFSCNQVMVCIEVSDTESPKEMAQLFLRTITHKRRYSTVYDSGNIGLIVVDGNINVDFSSIMLLAKRTLNKAKLTGPETVIDYADAKNI